MPLAAGSSACKKSFCDPRSQHPRSIQEDYPMDQERFVTIEEMEAATASLLENGKKVVIKANNNGEANRYISSMKVNGKNYTKNYLIHGDLMRGMNILYNMSATPNKSRGTQDSDAPYSFSNELGK